MTLLSYVVFRLAMGLLTLSGVAVIIFVAMRAMPGCFILPS